MQWHHPLRQNPRRFRMALLSSEQVDRREALRRAALLLGGAISAPSLAAALAACDAHASAGRGQTSAAAPSLTADQAETIATIAEQIIPETDTPGARGAGVPRFITTMLAEYYTPEERARFLAGLADVDARARARDGRPFLRCSTAQQQELVRALDAETFGGAADRAGSPATEAARETARGSGGPNVATAPAPSRTAGHAPPSFFRMMKELTVIGYYTSEPGATKELRYVQVPGRFDGCVPLTKIGRAWAV